MNARRTDTTADTQVSVRTAGEALDRGSIAPGLVLSERYELGEELGAGGMGTVFRARHAGLGTEVAIKILRPEIQANPEYARRFRREARAAYKLDHPHVVRVLDFGQQPSLFIVMEFIEGQSLASYLNGLTRPPELSFVLDVMAQILDALITAHAHGIIHRDLKPDNVLLTWNDDEPFVKVVDFGLAHFEDTTDAGPTLTQEGIVAGTPAYMSPEQCQSMAVTPSSDLYSMGCILTELLQLTPPFKADTPIVVMSQQMFVPPPALDRPKDAEPVPARVESLRLALLAKQSHRRPKSVTEARSWLLGEDPHRSTRRPRAARGSLAPKANDDAKRNAQPSSTVSVIGGTPGGLDDASRMGLSLQGVAVETACNADLVIVDLDVAFDALVSEVKRLSSKGRAVAVCLDDVDARRLPALVEAGAASLVSKPVDVVELARVIRAMEQRGLRRRSADRPSSEEAEHQ